MSLKQVLPLENVYTRETKRETRYPREGRHAVSASECVLPLSEMSKVPTHETLGKSSWRTPAPADLSCRGKTESDENREWREPLQHGLTALVPHRRWCLTANRWYGGYLTGQGRALWRKTDIVWWERRSGVIPLGIIAKKKNKKKIANVINTFKQLWMTLRARRNDFE